MGCSNCKFRQTEWGCPDAFTQYAHFCGSYGEDETMLPSTEERKVSKMSDVEFLCEKFKDIPNFVYGDCECDGAPGIAMIIPIEDEEIVLYFDFYGNLCKG